MRLNIECAMAWSHRRNHSSQSITQYTLESPFPACSVPRFTRTLLSRLVLGLKPALATQVDLNGLDFRVVLKRILATLSSDTYSASDWFVSCNS